jgi:hypothetical protein
LIDAALSLSIFTLISSHVFSLNLFQKSNRIPIYQGFFRIVIILP